MITWKIEAKDVDTVFPLCDILEFSRKWKARIIIPGVMTIINGGISYVN